MKQKFPRADAIAVARELVKHLGPHCDRIVIAGSLRRRKEEVGDVEILYHPKHKLVTNPFDMFEPLVANEVDPRLDWLITEQKVLERRKNANGSEMWGAENKYARHLATGIPVDLFLCPLKNWWNYLACRTGPMESNLRVASAAKRKGWHWHPYSPGFTDERGRLVTVQCERNVFEFVGEKYLEPWQR